MLRLRQRSPKATEAADGPAEVMPLALLEFQSPTAAIIAAPVPGIARHTVAWITLMVVILMLIAGFKQVDELVNTQGVLVSAAPTSSIQAFNPSIVSSINVSSGQLVHRGQILATLDPTIAAADLASLTSQEQGYAAQVAQLQAQEDGKPYLPDASNPASTLAFATYTQQVGQYQATMDADNQKINEDTTQIAGYQEQAAYFSQRLGVASNVEGMRESLQHLQVGSELDTLSATDERIAMQASLADAQSSAATTKRTLAQDTAERDSFDQQWKASISQQLATALNNLAQAQQQLASAKLNDQLVILTAPEDAIVQGVASISVGAVLQQGATLMTLVPVNAPLSITANIESSESGLVHVGDPATIKFNTLQFMQYGDAIGTVTSISPESVNPLQQSAVNQQLPGAPQTLYFTAQVSLDELQLHGVPKGFQLVPGMPVEADLKVGKHSILAYFTRRYAEIATNALHEP